MAAVTFSNVWKFYGAVEAVRDLCLDCKDGEMLALLGPSGCGKSTTLKMVAGIEEVSRGDIFFDQRPVNRLAPGERNIAMVFEDYALYPHLSVFENIAFPLKVRHAPAAQIKSRVEQAIDLLRLDGLRDDNVKNLSGGAQQRVSIGRALVRDPELILFDEPLSHLDADQKVELRAEIKRLQQTRGLTSILVTHDQTEAVAMSDRVAVMNHGVLQQVGTPHELYYTPANLFVAGFIGEPPMNLLPVEVAEDAGRIALVGAEWRLPLAGGPAGLLAARARSRRLIMGIRPENIAVDAGHGQATNGIPGTLYYREPRGDVDVLVIRLEPAAAGGDRVNGEGSLITCEVAGPSAVRKGDAVTITPRPEGVALFDVETGSNLVLT